MMITMPQYETGDIRIIPHNKIPRGWLLCDGSAISRTVYAALFAKIGTLYGSGDGSTTFNLPNFNNVIMQGTTDPTKVGTKNGANQKTLSVDNLPPHTHDLQNHTHTVPAHYHTQPTHVHGVPDHNHKVNWASANTSGTITGYYKGNNNTGTVTMYTDSVTGVVTSASGGDNTGTQPATDTTTPSVNSTGSVGSGTALSVEQDAYLMLVIIKT